MPGKMLRARRTLTALVTTCVLLVALLPGGPTPNTSAQSCPPGDPPHFPAARSFDDFIIQAYIGALGRYPNCFERQAAYDNLQNAYYGGYLLYEARRFVATLIMTQASYDDPDENGLYQQTSAYNARRPINPYDPNDTGNQAMREAVVTDFYRAFLQREPDTGGLCFWQNEIASGGRKHVVRAFELSIEFERLVNGLYEGARACCYQSCPYGYTFNFDTCSCEPDYCYPYYCY